MVSSEEATYVGSSQFYRNVSFKNKLWAGEMAQPLGALWKRRLPQFPEPTLGGLQLPATPSNSRRCNPLFWPLLPLAHVWHTPKQTHININKKK
ncbi:hypothetical protein ACRRTK_005206 [Alexandromys fortis]